MAEIGDTPKAITYGTLKSYQKPHKTKGPPSNLRSIILLSFLHKILAASSSESKTDSIQKYHHHKQSTDQIH